MPVADCLRVVEHLPEQMGRLILSGGEPLSELATLLTICDAVRDRHGPDLPLMLQTNGDLLTATVLEALQGHGVDRIDVAGVDTWHRCRGRRRSELTDLFLAAGWREERGGRRPVGRCVFSFWGASEDLWLGGNWPRGRALANGAARIDPAHNFCALWSGAAGFLDDGSARQEVALQLWQVFPCCPATYYCLGDAREESVGDILDTYRDQAAFRALNQGQPSRIPVPAKGARYARHRIRELGSVCLWCDEFFREHYGGPRGEARHFR
ncbi:MAG: radical SAM protein [Planctomycetota bacterium]|jgi:hypothetical protein